MAVGFWISVSTRGKSASFWKNLLGARLRIAVARDSKKVFVPFKIQTMDLKKSEADLVVWCDDDR